MRRAAAGLVVALMGAGCGAASSNPPAPAGSVNARGVATSGTDLAFPGAAGFGRSASGGRGGRVLVVTHLNAGGPGSFAAAVRAAGPRVVVFEVAGKIPIEGQLQVPHGDLTIACQSAPGGGVAFVGGTLVLGEFDDETPWQDQRNIRARNFLVRHCRFRDPAASVARGDQADGVQLLNVELAMLDHVSLAWAADESGAARRSRRITWQSCLITEPLIEGRHSKGAHPYGPNASYGTHDWSMIGCFLSNGWHRFPHLIGNNLDLDARSRRPNPGAERDGPRRPPPTEGRAGRQRRRRLATSRVALGPRHPVFLFAGNTVYNVGGPDGIGGTEVAIGAHAVIENNSYWRGPETPSDWLPIKGHDRPESADSGSSVHLAGNRLDGALPARQRDLVTSRYPDVPLPALSETRWGAPAPAPGTAADLVRVGALPHDAIDERVLREFAERSGRQGAPWRRAGDPVPSPAPGAAPADGDRDGMPDAWERAHGRDPATHDPWLDLDCNGWGDLEDYLNERAGDPPVPGAGC